VSAAVFLGVVGVIAWTWPDLLGRLREVMTAGLRAATAPTSSPTAALGQGLRVLVVGLTPVLAAAVAIALLANLVQVGPLCSLRPLKPELGRLAPLRNLKKLVGADAIFELFKSTVKVLGIGYLAFDALWKRLPRIVGTVGGAPEQALLVVADCLAAIAVRVAVLVVVVAVIDLLYQRHGYRKRLMMTRLEVRREQKEVEGDPQRRAERRRIHRGALEHQALESVAGADCVIIDPGHVATAVAIRYRAEEMEAPKLVARGRRLVAARIKEIARQHGVPIIRDVLLARALAELELDQEIPPALYEGVAHLLRFVYSASSR
jgi:flagellar biosynthetic protein FlhB